MPAASTIWAIMLFSDSKYTAHIKRAHRQTIFTRKHEAHGTWCTFILSRRIALPTPSNLISGELGPRLDTSTLRHHKNRNMPPTASSRKGWCTVLQMRQREKKYGTSLIAQMSLTCNLRQVTTHHQIGAQVRCVNMLTNPPRRV